MSLDWFIVGAIAVAIIVWMLRVSRRLKSSAQELRRMRQMQEGKSPEEIRRREIEQFLGPGPGQ